jgi:hypothetical protein
MPEYFCNADGCNSASRKTKNLAKYPWMKDITLHSFPHATRQKKLRATWLDMIKREDFVPNKYSRVCSVHFVGGKGPTEQHPIPTLFQYNNYGLPRKSRPGRRRKIENADSDTDSDTSPECEPVPECYDAAMIPEVGAEIAIGPGKIKYISQYSSL